MGSESSVDDSGQGFFKAWAPTRKKLEILSPFKDVHVPAAASVNALVRKRSGWSKCPLQGGSNSQLRGLKGLLTKSFTRASTGLIRFLHEDIRRISRRSHGGRFSPISRPWGKEQDLSERGLNRLE